MLRLIRRFHRYRENAPAGERPVAAAGPIPDTLDAALSALSACGPEIGERSSEPPPGPPPSPPRDVTQEVLELCRQEMMREVFELCRQEMVRRGVESLPAYRRRVIFELQAIEDWGDQAELLRLARSGQAADDSQNMLVLDLLGVGAACDLTRPPSFASGDADSICVPASGTAADLLAEFGIRLPPLPPAAASDPLSLTFSPQTVPPARAERDPEPKIGSRSAPMRGMELLRQARQRQAQVEAQVVRMAQRAAKRIADTLAQDIDFQAIRAEYGGTLYAVTRASGGWALAVVFEEQFRPHPSWTYEDGRRFGLHVRDGLVESMAAVLDSRVDEENAALGDYGVPDDEGYPPTPVVADEEIITALQTSHDDIPALLTRSNQ